MTDCSWIDDLPFLIPQWKNATVKHNAFMTCMPDVGGSGINIKITNDGNTHAESLVEKSDENRYCSQQCILPFFSADSMVSKNDPCLKLDDLKKQIKYRNYIHSYRMMLKQKNNLPFKESILKLRKKLNRSDFNFKKTTIPKKVRKLISVMPDSFDQPSDYNYRFIKGSLKYEQLYDNFNVIIHPSGEKMNKLTFTPINSNSDGDSIWTYNVGKQLILPLDKGPIYQISSSKCDYSSRMFCAIRQKHALWYYAIENKNDFLHERNRHIFSEKKKFHCVEVNPFYPGEIAYTKGQCCSINIMDMTKDTRIFKETLNTKIFCDDWVVEYGSHPRSIICCCNKEVIYKDARKRGNAISTLTNINSGLSNLSFYLFTKQNLLNNQQQFVVAQNELFLIDERFPSAPIQCWNHMLSTTPTSCNFVPLDDEISKGILLINSQCSQETCCITISKSGMIQPTASSIWHTSKPKDLVRTLRNLSFKENNAAMSHLCKSTIGSCGVVNNEKDLTIFHLTSIGDIFYQDFALDSSQEERTHIPSFGLGKSEITPKGKEMFYNWVESIPDVDSPTRPPLYKTECPSMLSSTISDKCFEGETNVCVDSIEQEMNDFVEYEKSKEFDIICDPTLQTFDLAAESANPFSQKILKVFRPEDFESDVESIPYSTDAESVSGSYPTPSKGIPSSSSTVVDSTFMTKSPVREACNTPNTLNTPSEIISKQTPRTKSGKKRRFILQESGF